MIPRRSLSTLKTKVAEIDPLVDIRHIRTLNNTPSELAWHRRLPPLCCGINVISIALCLASMGVYRRHRLLREPTHASVQAFAWPWVPPGTNDGMVLRQGFAITGLGVVIGMTLSGFRRTGALSFLFGVHPFDPLALVGVPLLLGGVTLLACRAPAFKASRVDPSNSLHSD